MIKVKKYLGFLVAMVSILTIGIMMGSKLENNKIEKINGNLYNSVKIAVVNLDEGIAYKDGQRNFAKEILENYSEDYVITGLGDAKSGIEDGRYAGYVILPASFSSSVVSINTTPEKSLLKYEISGNLSQEANDKAWQNVMKLKENLNDDLGYVYVSSILGEFHNGQDNALKVLANDSKDKDVIMAISNLDLVATLDLREVERLQNDIEDLDINPDIEKNATIISTIDEAYKGYLSETSTQLNDLKNDSALINQDYPNVEDASTAIKNLLNDDGSKNYSLAQTLTMLNQYNGDLNTSIINIFDELNKSLDNEKEDNTEYVNNKKLKLDDLVQNLDSNHVTISQQILDKINNSISDMITQINLDELIIDFNSYPNIKTILDKEEHKIILNKANVYINRAIIDALVNNQNEITNGNENIIDKIILSLADDIKLQECLKIYAEAIGIEESKIDKYNIKEYINDNKEIFKELVDTDINENNGKLTEDFKTALKGDVKDTITTNNNSLLIKIDKLIEDQSINTIKLEAEINKYKDELQNIPMFNSENLNKTISLVKTINPETINKQVDEDLTPLSVEQTNKKKHLIEKLNKHKSLNTIFYNNLILYNPLDAINQEQIEAYVNDYQSNNNNTKSKIEKKNYEYVNFVAKSYDNANQQVSAMKEDVLKYQKESDTKVTTGLDKAKSVKDETSDNNNGLMNSFISKLAYTRIGTVANNEVYDLVISSTNMEGNKLSNTTNENMVNYNYLFLIVSGACLTVWLGINIVEFLKNRSITKEDLEYKT